jgi:hypothetical protein
MARAKFVFVEGDDWVGLYIDGELAYEGHNMSPAHLAEFLDADFERIWADDSWLYEVGHLPKNLEDVKEEKDEE